MRRIFPVPLIILIVALYPLPGCIDNVTDARSTLTNDCSDCTNDTGGGNDSGGTDGAGGAGDGTDGADGAGDGTDGTGGTGDGTGGDVGDTYLIGGTVSGLSGSGLVLQNNGGDDLSISSDGDFTFSTALEDGSSYNVTVIAQPSNPGQNCTVTNGSGTVNSADITNVTVTCTTLTRTIGGMVSGLSGSGLVLQNNGGDDLTLEANGAFEFNNALADGMDYSVTVHTQPTGQSCTVTNASGTVSGANVTDVSLACVNVFTIGGTVSGLAGSGLELQNNGGDDLSISSGGAFTFATAFEDGDSYSVAVYVQPTGLNQNCIVGNGSGTVGGGDVSDVTITCTTLTYSIGGNVSGLDGSGLVLRNNGGDDLPIPSNVSFTFATSLVDGTAIDVTVFTQPASPDQFCNVIGGSGNLSGSDVSDVAIVCSYEVLPYYANGQAWNDYVKNDGADVLNANDTPCDGTETGGYSACIHGGEMRVVEVVGETSCTGLTASDALTAFDWLCDDGTGTARMISTGLQDGKLLSGLIDWNASPPEWLQNAVTVNNGTAYIFTSAFTQWWNNSLVVNNGGGSLAIAGTIYLVTANPNASYTMDADKVGLVVEPGVTLQGYGSGGNVIYATGKKFIWVDGTVDATGDTNGIYWYGMKTSAINGLTVENGYMGISLESSTNNKLSEINAINNTFGVLLANSPNNVLNYITANNNTSTGITLEYSNGNSFNNIISENNMEGIHLAESSNNTLNNVYVKKNNRNGVDISYSPYSSVFNVVAFNNGYDGINVDLSDNTVLYNIVATNNGTDGIDISDSSGIKIWDVNAANNGSTGIYLDTVYNTIATGITAANNLSYGVKISGSGSNNIIANITGAQNNSMGIYLYNPTTVRLRVE